MKTVKKGDLTYRVGTEYRLVEIDMHGDGQNANHFPTLREARKQLADLRITPTLTEECTVAAIVERQKFLECITPGFEWDGEPYGMPSPIPGAFRGNIDALRAGGWID